MKQKLFSLYNRCKSSFVEEMVDIVRSQGGLIEFSPHIIISRPHNETTIDLYLEVACVEIDGKDNICYINLQEVEKDDAGIEKHEYWSPLIDESFDTLFKIAEML